MCSGVYLLEHAHAIGLVTSERIAIICDGCQPSDRVSEVCEYNIDDVFAHLNRCHRLRVSAGVRRKRCRFTLIPDTGMIYRTHFSM